MSAQEVQPQHPTDVKKKRGGKRGRESVIVALS